MKLAARKLDIPESDVEMLLTMYHLYGDSSLVKLKPLDFVKYADELIREDADAQEFTDEEMTLTIRGVGESATSELARLARLGITAGFESRYTDGRVVLSAPVRSSATLKIYAVKPAWLRDLFEKCFKK